MIPSISFFRDQIRGVLVCLVLIPGTAFERCTRLLALLDPLNIEVSDFVTLEVRLLPNFAPRQCPGSSPVAPIESRDQRKRACEP